MRRVTNYLRILGLIGLLAGLAACMPSGKEAAGLLWPEIEDPYVKTTQKWTRSDAIYDGMNMQASAAATLKAEAWRKAYAKRSGDFYGATEHETAVILADELAAHKRATTVVLSLASPVHGYNVLSTKNPMWKVFAMQGGNKLYPSEIRLMEEKFWPLSKLKAAFPYANRWRKFYEVSFEPVAPGPLSVVVTGPAGTMELDWEYFE